MLSSSSNSTISARFTMTTANANTDVITVEESRIKPARRILRRRGTNNNTQCPTSSNRKQRRARGLTVHFPSEPSSIVTAVHTRPRTHALDVPLLYYTSQEVQRFKRNRKQSKLAESTEGNHSRQESLGRLLDVCCAISGVIGGEGTKKKLDNSFWRSKVQRRWSHAASLYHDSNSAVSLSSSHSCNNRSIEESNQHEVKEFASFPSNTTTNDGYTTNAGISSSIRDAMSVLNGYDKSNEHSTTASLHLVDTMYLF